MSAPFLSKSTVEIATELYWIAAQLSRDAINEQKRDWGRAHLVIVAQRTSSRRLARAAATNLCRSRRLAASAVITLPGVVFPAADSLDPPHSGVGP
jgi:hypothetical protein